ncbi:MAG: TAXI family TRAP transporter solute-binding subunit [Deferrisomatales bacterium]|nr:TAXI family TRAP transporter solute-binding subunit [Deferrisomatales bacterium]
MKRTALTVALLFAGVTGAAAADSVGIGTSNPGSIYHSSGSAVAKVANEKAGIPATIQPFASPNVWIPALNAGELQFGFANVYETTLAYEGREYFTGRPNPGLRAVAIVYPLRTGIFVKKDSDIKTMADLKGHNMPDGYTSQKVILPLLDAAYATGGITRADTKPIQVPNVVGGANAFSSGKADGFLFAIGSAKVREADAAVGGVRALPIENTPENLATIRKHFPTSYLRLVEPGPANPGVLEPTYVIAYDGVLVASDKTPEDMVYKLTKAMYENKADLVESFAVFKLFDPQTMAKDIPYPYHPGAIKFYKEIGQWPPK